MAVSDTMKVILRSGGILDDRGLFQGVQMRLLDQGGKTTFAKEHHYHFVFFPNLNLYKHSIYKMRSRRF